MQATDLEQTVFDISGLTYHYPHSDRQVLHGVDLRLERGQILSILGPNGAGKSTLLHCMAGLVRPQEGSVLLQGEPLLRVPRRQAAIQIGYVQQNHVPTFSHRVFDFVMMGRAPLIPLFARPGPKDEEEVWQVLEDLGIVGLANTPYTQISGGERQQCTIARALVRRPLALLFDEPTAHLDYGNQTRILKLMRSMAKEGYAVVMTTHNPDHVLLLGGYAAVMDGKGQLQYGPVEHIMTQALLQDMYGTDLRLMHVDGLDRDACLHAPLDM